MHKQIIRKLTLQSAVLLLAFTSSAFGKDPAIVELGRIQSGQVVPQIAAGLGEWSTAFQIFNLDPSGDSHEITLNFFQGVGDPLALELFDESGVSLGTMSSYDATLNAGGSTAIRTSTAGNLRVGYAVLEMKGDDDVGVPGFQLVGMTAILTRAGADNFRTAVPALPTLQDRLRLPFNYTGGFVTCVAWANISSQAQTVSLTARNLAGQSLSGTAAEKTLDPGEHEAFCLADRISEVSGNEGVVEITSDGGGIAAIGLAADSAFRIWTVTPYEIVGVEEDCVAFPSMTPPLDWMFEMTGTFGGDRLAVGRPASTPATLLAGVPNPSFANQRFCGLVELVNGVHAEVYVPTAAERTGDFSAYPAPITDPETAQPFAGNTIFGSRLDDVYAFRVRLPTR